MSGDDLLRNFPDPTREDIRACLADRRRSRAAAVGGRFTVGDVLSARRRRAGGGRTVTGNLAVRQPRLTQVIEMKPTAAPSGTDGTLGEAAEAQTRVTDAIEKLLRSIDRPGDFCVHGRLLAAMPRLQVEGAGTISFPVPETQIRALIAAAEPAPYGKGTETVVDRSIRNCWQIGPERVRLAGAAWPETFADILETAAVGLGCAPDRVDARLHRLLIYEPGGFFASHRDTEKADGMVATLSVSLPAAGAGGEIVVRHRDRERTIDMTAAEPSELAFAAFYADCAHEVRR